MDVQAESSISHASLESNPSPTTELHSVNESGKEVSVASTTGPAATPQAPSNVARTPINAFARYDEPESSGESGEADSGTNTFKRSLRPSIPRVHVDQGATPGATEILQQPSKKSPQQSSDTNSTRQPHNGGNALGIDLGPTRPSAIVEQESPKKSIGATLFGGLKNAFKSRPRKASTSRSFLNLSPNGGSVNRKVFERRSSQPVNVRRDQLAHAVELEATWIDDFIHLCDIVRLENQDLDAPLDLLEDLKSMMNDGHREDVLVEAMEGLRLAQNAYDEKFRKHKELGSDARLVQVPFSHERDLRGYVYAMQAHVADLLQAARSHRSIPALGRTLQSMEVVRSEVEGLAKMFDREDLESEQLKLPWTLERTAAYYNAVRKMDTQEERLRARGRNG